MSAEQEEKEKSKSNIHLFPQIYRLFKNIGRRGRGETKYFGILHEKEILDILKYCCKIILTTY